MTRASDVSIPKEQGMSQVRFEREGPVGSIVLNHPPQNRIGHQMMLDLTDAVAEASASDIRVLLVRGDGPDFCFGGDVREWPDATPHGLRSFTYRVNAAFRAIELLPIPTVAVVQGAAYGGGFELALSCDLILAAESAHFRGRFRDSYAVPRPLEPDSVHAFEIRLWNVSHVLRTGHRLRLHITSSDFPRWERNPGTLGPSVSATEALAADQTLFHDHEHPSRVSLPVVPR